MTPIKYADQLNATNWEQCQFLRVFEEYFGPDFIRPTDQCLPSDRKFRLFAVAAFRAVWERVSDLRSRAAVDAAEQYADDPNPAILYIVRDAAGAAFSEADAAFNETIPDTVVTAATTAAATLALESVMNFTEYAYQSPAWSDVAFRLGDDLVRDRNGIDLFELYHQFFHDIFGNPFRPISLDPAWLTSDVLALARGIYDERAFDRMPILADALQDAGCDNEDVLLHCRDANQVHVRGCWVVDLVLGKT